MIFTYGVKPSVQRKRAQNFTSITSYNAKIRHCVSIDALLGRPAPRCWAIDGMDEDARMAAASGPPDEPAAGERSTPWSSGASVRYVEGARYARLEREALDKT